MKVLTQEEISNVEVYNKEIKALKIQRSNLKTLTILASILAIVLILVIIFMPLNYSDAIKEKKKLEFEANNMRANWEYSQRMNDIYRNRLEVCENGR